MTNKSTELATLLNIKPEIYAFHHVNRTYKAYTRERLLEIVSKDFCGVNEDWYSSFDRHILSFKNPHNTIELLRIYGTICSEVFLFFSKDGKELEDDLIDEVLSAMKNRNKKFIKLMQEYAQKIEWRYY